MRIAVLLVLLGAVPAHGAENAPKVHDEGDTIYVTLWFCTSPHSGYCSVTTGTGCTQDSDCPGGETCDKTDTTNCPDGGRLFTVADLHQLQYRLDDDATGIELLGNQTVGSVTENPYTITIPYASVVFVGRCSDTGNGCKVDGDCAGSATCDRPGIRDNRQLQILTAVYQWESGTEQDVKEIPIWIRDMQNYPLP